VHLGCAGEARKFAVQPVKVDPGTGKNTGKVVDESAGLHQTDQFAGNQKEEEPK
jgi:hypothetical protein